jgi:hypothetical protein
MGIEWRWQPDQAIPNRLRKLSTTHPWCILIKEESLSLNRKPAGSPMVKDPGCPTDGGRL